MKILLTHDGSVMADNAAPRVEALASAAGPDTEVVALCITSTHAAAGSEEATEAAKSLDRIKRALAMHGTEKVSPMVLAGEPGPLIVETAEKLNCDLIAMATSGHSGPKQFLGSVADYVVRNSHRIPVMLCRPERPDRPQFKKVLLPLDGSELSAGAVAQAQDLATTTGAGVVLLRLIDTPEQIRSMRTPAGYELSAYVVPGDALRGILARENADARSELEQDATRLRAAGIGDVTVVTTAGTPGEAIVATADQLGCDVIVMSSRGRGSRDGARVLGSVADHVLQHVASGAVVLVPPLEVVSAVSAKS